MFVTTNSSSFFHAKLDAQDQDAYCSLGSELVVVFGEHEFERDVGNGAWCAALLTRCRLKQRTACWRYVLKAISVISLYGEFYSDLFRPPWFEAQASFCTGIWPIHTGRKAMSTEACPKFYHGIRRPLKFVYHVQHTYIGTCHIQ